ncbi:MAG: YkvA family protein [Allosphingosinicella sp.]|uniref:YkvA family protein n=1 Tax=Allosphingosinicella sp. TaxID=2823234 RepID=UPI0039384347
MPRRTDRRARRASLVKRIRIEAHAAWLAARDPRTPWHARAFGFLVATYALSPIDLIPDFIPVLGLVDDIVIIPAGMWLFARMVPEELFAEHRAAAAEAAERPTSVAGIFLILGLWALAAMVVLSILRWHYA